MTLQIGGERMDFSINGAGSIGYKYFQKINLDLYIPHTNINSWWIVPPNLRGQSKRQKIQGKHSEENTRDCLHDLKVGMGFSNRI